MTIRWRTVAPSRRATRLCQTSQALRHHGQRAAGEADADKQDQHGGTRRDEPRELRPPTTRTREPTGPTAAEHDECETGGGQRGRHPEPVPDDEQDAEGGAPQPDRAEQDDQRRRAGDEATGDTHADEDRKSTRLNSSHVKISYAVFCLKKKKKKK